VHASEKSFSAQASEKVLSVAEMERSLTMHGSDKLMSVKTPSVIGSERVQSSKIGSAAKIPEERSVVSGTGMLVYVQLRQSII